MAWIESHQSLGTHKKLIRLCSLLKIDRFQAVGLLHYLWWWSLDNVPDGDLKGLSGTEIALAIGYQGDGDQLVNALIESKWIDSEDEYQNGGALKAHLHDWDDYAGKLIDRRNANREKMRQYRNQHETVTKPLRSPLTVPNPTVPNPTVPKENKQKKYGEFQNVLLSDEEHGKLLIRFGELETQERIERLSAGISSKGYKYKSHYATILNWARNDNGKRNVDGNRAHEERPIGAISPFAKYGGNTGESDEGQG